MREVASMESIDRLLRASLDAYVKEALQLLDQSRAISIILEGDVRQLARIEPQLRAGAEVMPGKPGR